MSRFKLFRLIISSMVTFSIIHAVFLPMNSRAVEQKVKPNHLIHEKSPYLQQHVYNPVDWYPWGEEAFQKARRENKPIFLSSGYSTCHWCHVMERESFSDPNIAAIMNKLYVSIKVDREERPDVDKIYITAVSAMTGGAGWPLSVWLTPDLKPFYGGTYFPPDSRWGRPGFQDVLLSLAKTWQEDREKTVASSIDLTKRIKATLDGEGRKGALDETAFANGIKSFVQAYDSSRGGFGGAPKFPMPGNQNFLFRAWARTKDEKALEMSLQTLREMAKGGIYDQVGGGFHRYSTDAKWHIPHFEKMLYDNAQLTVNFLDAHQITRDVEFARVARETLEYVRRDMTHPQDGFYSAEDADSLPPELVGKVSDKGHEHRTEGAFYLWGRDEITKILGERDGEIASYRYGVEPLGNAGSDTHGEFKGKNILYAAHSVKEIAKKFGVPEKETEAKLRESRQKLFAARAKKPRPHLDDKILVSWNGLMISAFAKAGQILGDPAYSKAAERAAGFIRSNLYNSKTKTLSRRWREGESKIPGIADDYAFLTQGLLDLYETTFDVTWLEWAIDLTETQNKLFYDVEDGGFYMTSSGHDKNLLIRTKEDSDNVEPAASSVAALILLRLAQFTDRNDFRKAAEKTLSLFAEQMKQQPRSLPQMLVAMDYALSKPKQIILAGEPGSPDTKAMLSEIQKRFIPNKMVLVADQGNSREVLNQLLPFLKGVVPINKKATAYVCIDYACKLPTSDLKIFADILDGRR